MIIKVEIEGKTYSVTINDIHSNPVVAEVDGKRYQVYPEAQGPAVRPAASTAAPAPAAVSASAPPAAPVSSLTLNAPLPGVIVSLDVQAGQSVKAGQQVCTLEAMKMKNAIRADRDGVVAQVNVNPGDLVKHNQPILTFQA